MLELIAFIITIVLIYVLGPILFDKLWANYLKEIEGIDWVSSETEQEKNTYTKLVYFSSFFLLFIVTLNLI